MTWMEEMIKWIKDVRIRNGFFTPAVINDEPTEAALNKRDLRLVDVGWAMIVLAQAAEKARKGSAEEYRLALVKARDYINTLAHQDTSVDGAVTMSNRHAMVGKLTLVVTEVTEAMEDVVDDNIDHLGEELADTYIRLNDLCGSLNINIERQVERKMRINEGRPPKHGKLSNL